MRDGILSGPIDLDAKRRVRYPEVALFRGDVVCHLPSGTTGTVERFLNSRLIVRDAAGETHLFTVSSGAFEVGGIRCTPVVGRRTEAVAPTISASGSLVVDRGAQVARASRILVEGVHDAELLEKIWGDDLRYEGIVVERLDGIDDLATVIAHFGPGPRRRLGVLVDHLVEGTKEWRTAADVVGSDVAVCGHPYVDVWQTVKPSVAGIDAWPTVPVGQDWKTGVLARLGRSEVDPGAFWRELLGRVTRYADLEPPLVGAVEQLIDFVTAEPGGS